MEIDRRAISTNFLSDRVIVSYIKNFAISNLGDDFTFHYRLF